MSELAGPAEAARDSEVQSTLNKILERASNEKAGGVLLFNEEKTDEQKKANQIYDNLMLTIADVSQEAADKARDSGDEDYLRFLKEMKHVSIVTRAFADDEIPFWKDTASEEKRTQEGDEVYFYTSRGALLEGQTYDIRLMIRPRQFEKVHDIGGSVDIESRQPRMRFDIKPIHSDESEVTIRLDPGHSVTFDLVVPGIRQINLQGAGQEAGHHFQSQLQATPDEMAAVLEEINMKVQRSRLKQKLAA